jgi:predicted amino acid-binding ACT domain protein
MTKTRTGNAEVDANRWASFARWVKETRRNKGISQADAATAAGWSATNGKVSWCRYEAGEPARIETVARIAKGLDVAEKEALRMAGYLPSDARITVTYMGPDIVGIALAITQAFADFNVNATRTCMEGAEGISLAFVQMSGTIETADITKTLIEIDSAIRYKISRLFDEHVKPSGFAVTPWNLSVIHNPQAYDRNYRQIFDFRVIAENKPGEIHKLVEFLTKDEHLNIISIISVQTPSPLAYTENSGQCGHLVGAKGNVDNYTAGLTRRLACKLGISDMNIYNERIEFKLARTKQIYRNDNDFNPPLVDQSDELTVISNGEPNNNVGLAL